MCVRFAGSYSTSAPLLCGGPQGSILGPSLVFFDLLPLDSILNKHVVSFHCYADAIQINMHIKRSLSINPLLLCFRDIKDWMPLNFNF